MVHMRGKPTTAQEPNLHLPIFVNKVLLKHNPANLFTYCLCLLLCYIDSIEQLQERPYIYLLALYRKILPIRGLHHWLP